MSEAVIAYGATVERSVDGTSYTSIPEAKGVAVPVVSQEYPEVTNLDSTGGFREYIKGLKDAGEITLPCNYTPAGYALMVADQNEAQAVYYRVTMPLAPSQTTQGDVFEYRGFPVPELEGDDVGAIVGMNVNIRTTGNVTWTQGS